MTAVVVFTRAPTPGEVKTRLIPMLGAEGAAALHRHMVEHAVTVAVAAAIGSVTVCATPAGGDAWLNALARRHGCRLRAQGDGDLGARMHHALGEALARDATALLIGTDCPSRTVDDLRDAAAMLERDHDVVLGPAADGGYVMVGLRVPCAALFTDMPWGGTEVLATTRARAATLGLRVGETRIRHDIDEPGDLRLVPREWLAGLDGAPLPP